MEKLKPMVENLLKINWNRLLNDVTYGKVVAAAEIIKENKKWWQAAIKPSVGIDDLEERFLDQLQINDSKKLDLGQSLNDDSDVRSAIYDVLCASVDDRFIMTDKDVWQQDIMRDIINSIGDRVMSLEIEALHLQNRDRVMVLQSITDKEDAAHQIDWAEVSNIISIAKLIAFSNYIDRHICLFGHLFEKKFKKHDFFLHMLRWYKYFRTNKTFGSKFPTSLSNQALNRTLMEYYTTVLSTTEHPLMDCMKRKIMDVIIKDVKKMTVNDLKREVQDFYNSY